MLDRINRYVDTGIALIVAVAGVAFMVALWRMGAG